MNSSSPPAPQLPVETIAVVREEVDRLVEGILEAVARQSPAYGAVLRSPEGIALRLGVEQAIRAFLDAVERGEWVGEPRWETDELWRRLGENEFQSGRDLEDLRGAFRIGTRAAWRGAADLAVRAEVSAPVAIALAEMIFVYGDQLAADVVEGYLRAQTDEAGERERRRRRLASLLIEGAEPEAVARAADQAEWPLPQRVAAVALAVEDPGPITRRLDGDTLTGGDGDGAWLLVPDPDGPGRAASLQRAFTDAPADGAPVAALGPVAGLGQAQYSLRWARRALGLAHDGILEPAADGRPLIRVDEHLVDLLLFGDGRLAAALADRRLGRLSDLGAGERDRLLETLSVWLSHQRHTPSIAARLHVHPQTVRYRMARLRELLGESLDDPDRRLELMMAVRIARSGPGGLRAARAS
jgi:hypothetical protein